MKVERQKQRIELAYDELEQGHLYIDASDPDDLDVYLATDDGVTSLEDGYHYPAREEGFPNDHIWIEVGGKAVINE